MGVYQYTWRALELVWATNKGLTLAIGGLTLAAGLLPASIAWVGKQIVDGVILAADTGATADQWTALMWVAVEMGLVALVAGAQRGLDVCQSLLRAQLGHKVNVMILLKALELDLEHFEDSEFYDKMTRARREASSRPLALVRKSFGLVQNTIALLTYGALLLQFSGWAVLVLAVAAIPSFVAETRFAGQAFTLFRWRAPETREQMYLETVVAREDFAKEVQLLSLGETLVTRYRDIFTKLYAEDRNLTIRRGFWGFSLGLVSMLALYGAYGWIAYAAIGARITLGEMTMYLMVFKQGQSAFSAILSSVGGMYEDNLYLSNLYEFLAQEIGTAAGEETTGPDPSDGIRFEDVSFVYPGSTEPAVRDVSFHLKPGSRMALVGHNGSGKTTLVKLLTRLYTPTSGRISLDGRDLQEWEPLTLRRRVGVIFQDFVKYQFTVGENIGVGDVRHLTDEGRWARAAEKGMATEFIAELEGGWNTQLGRWFKNGRELSIGQWQKIALSRAFMQEGADILVLDEPTSAMDAEAEARVFQRLSDMSEGQMAILISHRFSTVRMADEIVVLHQGEVVEEGGHDELMAENGRYAHLFTLQAKGYR